MKAKTANQAPKGVFIRFTALALIAVLIPVMSLTGCIYLSKNYNYPHTVVESIEIYDLNQESIPCFVIEEKIGEYEPTWTLSEDKFEGFMDELGDIKFRDGIPMFAPSDPNFNFYGYTAKIIFSNEIKLYICADIQAYVSADGKVSEETYHCKDIDWLALLVKYVK